MREVSKQSDGGAASTDRKRLANSRSGERSFAAVLAGLLLAWLGLATNAIASSPAPDATSTNQPPAPVVTQGLFFEVWENIATTDLDAFLTGARYLTGEPDFRALASPADSRSVYPDDTHDNYGGRMSGWLNPKETGRYELFLRSADSSELWLSPTDQASDLVPIAMEPECCHPFEESGDIRTSAPITLVAGQKYAMQVVWTAGVGPDYAQVAWRKTSDLTPSAALAPIQGEFLLTNWDPTVGPPQITQKTLQFSGISSNATLTLQAIGTAPIQYDWAPLGGKRISAGTNNSLVITNVALTNIGSVYTVTLQNSLGTAGSQFALIPNGTLFVEAEDFNFDGGRSITNQAIGMTGSYSVGAFYGQGTALDMGIDYNAGTTNATVYRTNTLVTVESRSQTSDLRARGQFDVAINYVVSSNAPGFWYNYTRTFPTPAVDYYVLGQFTGDVSQVRVQMDEVTSGITTNQQTLRKLGEFTSNIATNPPSGTLTNLAVLPLTDTTGKAVVLTNWGGTRSFRVTLLAGSAPDLDYFMFVPVHPPASTGSGFSKVTRDGNNLVLEWTEGTLESADIVTGPWTPVPNATSPATIPIGGGKKFYRLH